MVSKKLSKKQIKEKQIIENRKFKKYMIIVFSLLFILMTSIYVFYTNWCETKYTYRIFAMYGKEIPKNLVCMNGNKLEHHESIKFISNDHIFYVCSVRCKENIIHHYENLAFISDAFSGDTICKANALIGIRERGKPEVVYFKDADNFNNYYLAINSK